NFGLSVDLPGDVNLDGYPDVLAGAFGWDDPNGGADHGRVYLLSGRNGTLLMALAGENAGDQMGIHASGCSDVNVDGHPDVLAGAWFWDDPGSPSADHGRIYAFSGKDGALLLARNGETPNVLLGRFVGHAGDVNLDG